MVRAFDVNKDIRSIAKKVKTAVFSYDDIHNQNIDNEFHYDYERVISEVQRLRGGTREETIKNLSSEGILSALPNGEYKVEVGATTKTGGGVNYDGLAFFSLSKEDYSTKYHELAHSLQKEYDLFDDDKINKLYSISKEGMQEEVVEDKQIDNTTYKQYLREMHSESFAYAALMLRARNPLDFARQAFNAYSEGGLRNGAGFLSFGKTEYGGDNNNAKFYATYPVMKETIRTIYNLRKQGKDKAFFDENGVLNDEKLARLTENIVLKSAYSPRTLNSYFSYKIFDGHNDKEHGWRLDTLKSMFTFSASSVMMFAADRSFYNTIKQIGVHKKLEREERAKIRKTIKLDRHFDNPELQALHDYIQLNARCADMTTRYKGEGLTASLHFAQATFVLKQENADIHEASIRDQARIALSKSNKEQYAEEKVVLSKFVQQRANNPYFCHLVATETDMAEVVRMYQEKLAHPEKTLIEHPEPVKKFPAAHNRYFAANGVISNMEGIMEIAGEYNCSEEFQKRLIKLSQQPASVIDDKQTREKLANAVQFKNDLFGRKKKHFKRDLNEFLDNMSKNAFEQRNNSAFKEICAEIADGDASAILAAAEGIRKEELQRREEQPRGQAQPTAEDVAKKEAEAKKLALNRVNANLQAIDYLVDQYGCSSDFKQDLVACMKDAAEISEHKEFYHVLVDEAQIKGDFFGITKKHFKKDLKQLLDGFHSDIQEFSENAFYQETVQKVVKGEPLFTTENNVSEPTAQQPQKQAQEERTAAVQQTQAPAQVLSAKEMVKEKLHSWGVEDGSYLIFTPEDNVYTTYGSNEVRSAGIYFEEGAKNIKETGKEVVYGTNNGLVGAYFAEGAYVVSNNFQLRSKLFHKGEDNNFGVMLSNGEQFACADGSKNDLLNYKWKNAKQKGSEINEVIRQQYQERQKRKEKEQTRAQTSQQIGSQQINRPAASR